MDVRKFLIRIAAELGEVLNESLAGIYVHGSLAMGTFLRHASDVDVLVLVNQPLPPGVVASLRRTLRGLEEAKPVEGALELTVLQQRHALRYEHPVPAELQWNSKPGSIPAQLVHVKQRGVRLTGPPPEDAVGLVPWHAFMQSVMESFESKAHGACDPAGLVLNACRTLYDVTMPAITVVDKFAAAQWALGRVPERFHALIRDALQQRRENVARSFDRDAVDAFRAYVAGVAEPAFAKVRDDDDEDDD